MVKNGSLAGIMVSIVITSIFVSYIIGVSVDKNNSEGLPDYIVSCDSTPCDYTSVGATFLGIALSVIVAGTIYYKERQITKRLDVYAKSHKAIAELEIPPYLEAIHEAAESLIDVPLPSENFTEDTHYRLIVRNMKTIRDIYLISGGFLEPDLSHDLLLLLNWIEHDFQTFISQQNILGYTKLRDDSLQIITDYFPNYKFET